MTAAKKVLIIDDEADFASLVSEVAVKLGFETSVASGGREFQALYARSKPDIIVLDMVMPGMDGIELMRWLVAEGCDARVLIISGHSPIFAKSANAINEIRGKMSVRILQKPVKLADLRAELLA